MLRLAEEKDYMDCLRMAKSFHQASPYSQQEFSEEKCRAMFQKYLSGNKTDIIIILAEDVSPYGMIVGMSSELPFSDSKISTELVWWVDKDKRGKRESVLLFKAFEDWSKRINSKLIAMAMLDESTDLSSFYTKQGYVSAERTFFKEV